MRSATFALLAGLAACSGRTEIVLGFATDLRAPDALDEIDLVVERQGVPFIQQKFPITGTTEPNNMPASFGIFADGGDDLLIDITLSGVKGNETITAQHAIMTLIDGQTQFYRMGITAGCIDRTDCADGETCVEGACQDVHVDARQLPPFSDALVTTVTCLGPVTYLETNGGKPMAPSDDAGDCPANLCVQGTCLKPPPPPDPSVDRTVAVTALSTFVQTDGTVDQLPNAGAGSAFLVDADGARFDAEAAGSGTFSFAAVPEGTYQLHLGNDVLVAEASFADLTTVTPGRSDVTIPASDAALDVALSNLDPWVVGDQLEAFSSGADTFWFSAETLPENTSLFTAGVTTATPTLALSEGFTSRTAADGTSVPAALIEAAKHDSFAVEQLHSVQTGGVGYLLATKIFFSGTVAMADGQTTPVTAALAPVALDHTIDLHFRASDFDKLVGASGGKATKLAPSATLTASFLGVVAQAGNLTFGNNAATADFLIMNIPTGSADVTVPGLQFGTPFPPGERWTAGYLWGVDAQATYMLPGTSQPARIGVGTRNLVDVSAPTDGNFGPLLGPVQSPQVDGQDLFSVSSTMSLTPTVSWEPSAVGGSITYEVEVFHLVVSGTKTTSTVVVHFFTGDTAVVVPDGVLQDGQPYVVRITATNNPNPRAPLRSALPNSQVLIASGIITARAGGGTGMVDGGVVLIDAPAADAPGPDAF